MEGGGPCVAIGVIHFTSYQVNNRLCLFQMHALNFIDKASYDLNPKDQAKGATLMPFLEMFLEGAHWRSTSFSCRQTLPSQGGVSNHLMLRAFF